MEPPPVSLEELLRRKPPDYFAITGTTKRTSSLPSPSSRSSGPSWMPSQHNQMSINLPKQRSTSSCSSCSPKRAWSLEELARFHNYLGSERHALRANKQNRHKSVQEVHPLGRSTREKHKALSEQPSQHPLWPQQQLQEQPYQVLGDQEEFESDTTIRARVRERILRRVEELESQNQMN